MPIPQGFQKAKLEIDGQEPIECGFNPAEYTIVKTNVWTFKPRTGVDLPDGEFGGGNPRMIRLALLLDVSLLGENESIREVTDRLFKMMETGGGGGGGGIGPALRHVHLGLGQHVQGRRHEPQRPVQALPPQRRADPR